MQKKLKTQNNLSKQELLKIIEDIDADRHQHRTNNSNIHEKEANIPNSIAFYPHK